MSEQCWRLLCAFPTPKITKWQRFRKICNDQWNYFFSRNQESRDFGVFWQRVKYTLSTNGIEFWLLQRWTFTEISFEIQLRISTGNNQMTLRSFFYFIFFSITANLDKSDPNVFWRFSWVFLFFFFLLLCFWLAVFLIFLICMDSMLGYLREFV